MKILLLLSLTLFTMNSYATDYQVDIQIKGNDDILNDYSFVHASGEPTTISISHTIPIVANGQTKLSAIEVAAGEDYKYENFEIKSDVKFSTHPMHNEVLAVSVSITSTHLTNIDRQEHAGKIIDITSTRTIDIDTNLIYDLNSKNCRIINKTNSEKGSLITEVCLKKVST